MSNTFLKATVIIALIAIPAEIVMIATNNDFWLNVFLLLLSVAGIVSARNILFERQKLKRRKSN